MWQQSIQPARPRRKLLNPAMLKNIVSAVAQKRLECVTPASKVAEIYTLNKQSQRIVRRKLEACDSVNIGRGTVAFRGPHAETQWLNSTMFCALLEHNELVFPEVTFDLYGEDDSKFYKLLSGIERLRLPEMSAGSMWSNEVVARLIHKNQRSLKVLEMPMELLLFSLLPPGLKLEEFITRAHPYDFKAYRTLETKVFKSKCGFGRVPPAFLRSVNADEVYLEVCNMWPNAVDPPTSQPPNSRVKKLAVDVVSVEFNDFYFDRIVRDVYAMCPTLECFEWLSTFRKPSWASSSALFRGEVDSLTARFEQEVEKCTAPFTIFLKASFQYTAKSREEVSDLARRCFDVDLPPACSVHGRREHYHLVKETRFDKKSLHMDFSISVIPPN
ncbi:hypothetical protein AAVH_20330 [Aphelenchoides avenae]|nr:hypothetical protein AAVH_20330 [Aphelenchus avenae]